MYTDVTGVILAGGKSRRMGENKALLKIGSITIIERITGLLKGLFSKVILITNDPDDYSFLGLEMYPDIYFNKGPLAGIHSALINSPTEKNFIISCDIPFITAGVIRDIINIKTEQPITVVRADGFIQQLVGVYNKQVLSAAEELLNGNYESIRCRVLTLIEKCGAEIIDAGKLPSCRKETFFNMNSPEDYVQVINSIEHTRETT